MNEDNYEDIINLPHPTSKNHPRMSREARAAQFAPFAALTGYSDAIKEKARLTDERIEIDEELKIFLNNRLKIILDNIKSNPLVTFKYFIYDKKKTGGKYVTVTGNVKKINMFEKYLTILDDTKIPIDEIIDINSDIFKTIE